MALVAASQAAAPSASSGIADELNGPDNAIRSCEVVHLADGDHVVIAMARHGAGNAIHIDADFNFPGHDYLIPSVGKARRFSVESKTLGKLDRIDIPVRTAIGLRGKRTERIFTRSGDYSISIGYGFRESDEAEVYGACSVTVRVK
ncbi:MAG: hypothetical protein K2X68_12135 [Novosphingobium sp.]|nr:hypothetical protein [Novosphingobium sp.]